MSTPAAYLMDGELPKNATEWERTLASQVERLLGLGFPIRDLWSPQKCPLEFLPYLAWSLSVDVWNPDWPEHRKRAVCAQALQHHGIKGTLAAFETYAALVDSEVLRAITPPGRMILSGGITDEQRRALAERMPQIRIYNQRTRATAGRRVYLSGRAHSAMSADRVIADSHAYERLQPRVRFFENGVESPINIEEIVAILPGLGRAFYERALLRRPRRRGVFYLGQPSRFLTSLDPTRAVASFHRETGAPTNIIRYGLKPSSVNPEPFYERGRAGRGMFLGRAPRRHYLGATDPETRVFERIVIWDPALIPKRRSASYLGVTRFGVKPFQAELVVSIPGNRPKRAVGVGPRGFIGKFFAASDGKKFNETMDALRAAKAVRDTVLVNTKTFRPATAGSLIVAGAPFRAGRLLRS